MDNVGAAAAADSLRLQEEIHSLMLPETPSGGGGGGGGSSSFTALLGLPPKQAIELLHALPDPRVKPEPADSGSASPRRPPKRKEPERTNAKPNGGKKGKSGEESRGGGDGGEEKLPYVHVRARRGQATDSHSLAERARREKINARMKLLQELVPGCSKISGTALVLDEIINHVQSLQKQVEFLSMRLAAVNPIFDVSALDSFLPSDDVRLAGGVGGGPALRLNGPLWGSQATVDGARRQHHQLWQADQATPQLSQQPLWTGDTHQYHHHHGALPLQIRLRNSSSCEREPDEDGAVISGRM